MVSSRGPNQINKPLVAGVFCFLFLLAAILSYQSAPPVVSVSRAPEIDDTDGDPLNANLDDGDDSREIPNSNKDGASSDETKVNIPQRTQEELEESIVKDEEKLTVVRGQRDEEVVHEEEDESQAESDEDGGEELPKSHDEKEAAEMSAKEEAANPERKQAFTLEYDVTDEDCKTSRRLERVGLHGGPRLQYVHLPKTGGTSVQVAMVDWAIHSSKQTILVKCNLPGIRGSSFVCPFGTPDATILIGHRGFGFCSDVERSPRGLFTFATFRRSASRIVSLFDYNRNREEPRTLRIFGPTPLGTWIKRFNATTEVEEGEFILRFAGSQQTRFMCGYECLGPNVKHNKTVTLPFMMRRAKENLRKLDIIGLTEELNECIAQIKFHLTLQKPTFKHWPEANEMSRFKKTELDPEALAILEEWGKPDQELYDYARVLYLKKQAIAKECRRKGLVPGTSGRGN